MRRLIAAAAVAALLTLVGCAGGGDDETGSTTSTTAVRDGWMEGSPDHAECLRLARTYDAVLEQALGQLGSPEWDQWMEDLQAIVDRQMLLRC